MPVVGPFSALGYRFRLDGGDALLSGHLDDLFRGLAVSGEGGELLRVRDDDPATVCDGSGVAFITPVDRLLRGLCGHLNQQANLFGAGHLLLHAGAVASGSRAVLLPGAPGSGKSTLTAGLVDLGLDYVTDETVAIAEETMTIDTYAKPLSLERGSWGALPHLAPVVGARLQRLHAEQWQVAPDRIRAGAVAGPCRPALIVAPRYRRGTRTEIHPVSKADAVVMLAENSFNFATRGRALLSVAGAVVSACECYRLTVGDLRTACDHVLRLMDAEERAST